MKSYISLLASSQEKTELGWWHDIKIKHKTSKQRTIHTKMDCRQWLLNQWRHHYMQLCWVWKNTTENGGIIVVRREKSMATSGANKIRLQSDFSHWKMQQTWQFLLWKELKNSNRTESHHFNHMNKKEQGSIRHHWSWRQKMTFCHKKLIKTGHSFCKTHNEMMIQQWYIPAWEEKAFLVPCMMQRRSWCEVAGGRAWQGTQVSYTSVLRGPSRKAATAHFHVENHVKLDILWAAAERAHNLKKNVWWISIQADGIWNSE